MSQAHVIVTATSPMAFLPLGNSSVVATAVNRARAAQCQPTVSVWVDPHIGDRWLSMPDKIRPTCVVSLGATLLEAVADHSANIILIHDAQRPLTLPDTFDRVVDAVREGSHAARPSHVVVDTLKTVDEAKRITGTINRDLVQSLTSPEGFHRDAIDFAGVVDEWSLPLKSHAEIHYVRGDQESLRVRETEDVLLVESFLAWQTYTK